MKKKKLKPRIKSSWELVFIEEHGEELHEYILGKYSRYIDDPLLWRSLLIAGCAFDPPLTPKLKKLYDDFMSLPPEDYEEVDNEKS